jgi:alkylated DNA repair dioxygenase AlkB
MEQQKKLLRMDAIKNAECFLCQDLFSDISKKAYQRLLTEIPWSRGTVVVYGKEYEESRKTCLFSDVPGKTYHYAGKEMMGEEWNPIVKAVKILTEELIRREYPGWKEDWSFDTCLCNYYSSGKEKIGWHSDAETDLVIGRPIASVSFGAVRRFDLRCKNNRPNKHDDVKTDLSSGSLIVMGVNTQTNYIHSIPQQMKIEEGRINLTFRMTK